jgi:hypothetical protein
MGQIELGFKMLTQVAVAVPGTAVPLSAVPLLVTNASIQWHPSNGGQVYLGESDVTSAKCMVLSTGTPVCVLEADDTVSDEDKVYFDLNKIYIDSAVAGDKVCVAYSTVIANKY